MQKSRYDVSWRVVVVVVLVAAISVLHFVTSTERIYLHQIYQRSYYIPIVLASFWFEIWGGLLTAGGLTAVYLVHILRHWSHQPFYSFQQYTEIAVYFVVAVLTGALSRIQRRARERLETAGAELSEAYRKLNDMFDQLRHADKLAALGQLSSGIVHEIRNPLGSIQGAVEILGRGLPSEDPKREFAQIARAELARLNKLLNEILRFSKPAAPSPMPTDPAELIEAALRLCSDQAKQQSVDVKVDTGTGNNRILVDPEQIKQVLLNILINALQVQPEGGRVEIRSRTEGSETVISIGDSGPGISRENLDRIFDPFFTTKGDGTGLGLSISYQLVRNNGGRIRVTSPPGEGACFEIAFPAMRTEDSMTPMK
jgi:two-component system, NtrC family, sensor histidine kinase HydH